MEPLQLVCSRVPRAEVEKVYKILVVPGMSKMGAKQMAQLRAKYATEAKRRKARESGNGDMAAISAAASTSSSSTLELELAARAADDAGGDGTYIADPHDLLAAYCTMRGFMASGHSGVDGPRGARTLLKDYVSGKLLYCHPPPDGSTDGGKKGRKNKKEKERVAGNSGGATLNALRDPTLKEIVEVELEEDAEFDEEDEEAEEIGSGRKQEEEGREVELGQGVAALAAGEASEATAGLKSVSAERFDEEDLDLDLDLDLDDDAAAASNSVDKSKRMHKKANRTKRGRKSKIRREDPYREEEERRALGIDTDVVGVRTLGRKR